MSFTPTELGTLYVAGVDISEQNRRPLVRGNGDDFGGAQQLIAIGSDGERQQTASGPYADMSGRGY